MTEYRCPACDDKILKVFEVRTAVHKWALDEDREEIDHYGNPYYTWECPDGNCIEGLEWSHKLPELWSGEA